MSSITIPTTGGGGGGAILSGNSTSHPYTRTLNLRHVTFPLSSPRPALHVAAAKKSFSSRSNRLDGGKSRRDGGSTTTREQDGDRTAQIKPGDEAKSSAVDGVDDGYFLPKLPGDEPDFWEGEKWDALGFFVEYMWAFGILFAILACGLAVLTYNEGATDFKDTPAYKESLQTQEFIQEPETSSPDVFESNPTEVAPSLE